ncbi:hypothetical protein OC845_000575 [Tilletia horrida]|nr:hypothetical protein OC845_000575 [Tilletia horrida]
MQLITSLFTLATAAAVMISTASADLVKRQGTPSNCQMARSFGPYAVTHVPANKTLPANVGYPGDVLPWVFLVSGDNIGALPNGTIRVANYLYETNAPSKPTYLGSPRFRGAYQVISGENAQHGFQVGASYPIGTSGLTNGTKYTMSASTIDGNGKIVCADLTSFQFTYISQRPAGTITGACS